MLTCRVCEESKKDSEFMEDCYGGTDDICKECFKIKEDEHSMSEEESKGWEGIKDKYTGN